MSPENEVISCQFKDYKALPFTQRLGKAAAEQESFIFAVPLAWKSASGGIFDIFNELLMREIVIQTAKGLIQKESHS